MGHKPRSSDGVSARLPPPVRKRSAERTNVLWGSSSIIARKVISMPQKRRIVVTDCDLALLHRLAGHPRLAAELKNAVVVDSRRVPLDVVTMNSRVQFEDETTGECREVTIVYPQQADASKAWMSVLAPTGTALLGLAVGQSIVWPFPDGATRCLSSSQDSHHLSFHVHWPRVTRQCRSGISPTSWHCLRPRVDKAARRRAACAGGRPESTTRSTARRKIQATRFLPGP